MNRDRWINLVMALLGFTLLFSSGRQHGDLVQHRSDFIHAYAPPEDVPPYVHFVTVAMGGFRGIMADVLWMRLSKLQEEKRYFEIVQLAEWICKLEPQFPEVWEYQAWNNAYNISVLFSTPEERWRWVRHGITLLRNEGLVYNPTSAKLHWELGWIYQHKMGQDLDQMHFWYKLFWAREMSALFGGPRPDYEQLALIPARPADLLAMPGVREYLAPFEGKAGDPFRRGEELRILLRDAARVLPEQPEKQLVMQYLRLRLIREEYRLEPETMREVDEQYGPFDWRLPQAHSAYWAYRGQEHAKGFYEVHLKRMIFQSMAMAFNEGWLFTDPTSATMPRIGANLDLYPKVMLAYEEAIAEHPGEETYTVGHRNFMIDAVQKFWLFGRKQQAAEVYADLRKRYPKNDVMVSLDQFLANTLLGEMRESLSRDEAAGIINGAINQALRWQISGDADRAGRFLEQALILYREYMSRRPEGSEFRERSGLPAFKVLLDDARTRLQDELEAEQELLRRRGSDVVEESRSAHRIMLERLREKVPGEAVLQQEATEREAGIL